MINSPMFAVAWAAVLALCVAVFAPVSLTSVAAQDVVAEGSMVQNNGIIDVAPAPGRITCSAAHNILADKGYRDISSIDCVGQLYRFNVSKNGKAMTVLMNADSAGYFEVY